MKIIVLLVVCVCVFYIGYLFTSLYKRKLQIFSDLIKLCDLLENKIKFKKELVPQILNESRTLFCKEFNFLIDELYFKIGGNIVGILLSDYEFKIVKQFFDSIGTLDVEGEISNVKANSEQFKSVYYELKANNKTVGELGVKLGVLLSILVFIIFV